MSTDRHYALIMAGGRGTRFWPRSRRRRPKQLQPLVSSRSLLQETVERLRPLVPPERTWVVTGEALRREVIRQLPEVPRRQIIAEPASRNTAPCIGLGAQILASLDAEAVMGVFPADHRIGKAGLFRRFARAGYRCAAQGHLVVMGIEPRWPETGFGYIEFPAGAKAGSLKAIPVRQFREKPDLKTAERFLAARRFYWNSGIFFWRADVFLESLRRHLPKTAAVLSALPAFGSRRFGPRLKEVFPLAENISVDYAVLEKAKNVMGLAAGDIGWDDLGSWNAVYKLLAEEEGANVARSDALLVASRGNYIESDSKLVAMLGVNDLVVVDTPDALLIAARSHAQQVGDIVKLLERLNREDLL